MLNSKGRTLTVTATVFIAIEFTLCIAVQLIGGRANDWISFSAVVLACLFHVLFVQKTRDYALTQSALVCTVMADLFLLITEPRHPLAAMCFFSVTQAAYFLRIYFTTDSKRMRGVHFSVRILLTLVMCGVTFAVLGDSIDALSLISVLYYTNLILNVVFAFVNFTKARLLAIGLLLFSLCDLFVGLSMLDGYLPVTEGTFIYFLAHPGFNAAWLFYVPAQMLLALSLINYKNCSE